MTKRATRTGKGGRDSALVLKLFDRLHPAPSWKPWRAWLHAVFGLVPPDQWSKDFILKCTGRTTLPTAPASEVWNVIARRAGKGVMAAFLAAYFGGIRTYRRLAPGERPRIRIIAADRTQAGQDFEYITGLYDNTPELAHLVARRTASRIDLSNMITIEVGTASFRGQRNFTSPLVILDEAAYFYDAETSANPDREIVRGVRPALATLPGALLLVLSSPYWRRGELFNMHERFFGRDESDILVWQASSLDMNPTLDPHIVEKAYDLDPDAAASDFGASFRSDLADLFPRETLAACVVTGRRELLPQAGTVYSAFADPSGGSNDSMTLAIAHKDVHGCAILDLLREWVPAPTFDPAVVTAECAATLKRFGLTSVAGDKYAAQWVVSAFAQHNIVYQHSDRDKSALFLELVPILNAGQAQLLDHTRLLGQLGGLQRRTGRSGKDAIDHRPGAHDDLAVAACGAIVTAVSSTGKVSLDAIFRGCVKNSGLSEQSRVHCVLHGGGYQPSDPICRKECRGWQAVEPQWRAYQRTDGPLPLRLFVRERFTSANMERNMWGDLIREAESMYGV